MKNPNNASGSGSSENTGFSPTEVNLIDQTSNDDQLHKLSQLPDDIVTISQANNKFTAEGASKNFFAKGTPVATRIGLQGLI